MTQDDARVKPADDEAERCFVCDQPFKPGDMVLPDVDGGTGHRACFGENREGYCNLETGEPLGSNEPIPTGYPWSSAHD